MLATYQFIASGKTMAIVNLRVAPCKAETPVVCGGGGGGLLPTMDYAGRLYLKEYLFLGWRYRKG